MSNGFRKAPRSVVQSIMRPTVMSLFERDGKWVINQYSDPNEDLREDDNVLQKLGHVLERFVTLESPEFDELMRLPATPEQMVLREEERVKPQAYSFLKVGDCLFRSQLDCYDATSDKVFDIKTRATAGIRYNIHEFQHSPEKFISHHTANITKVSGQWSSYEREYYDLIRSKFLPFSFQLRIGQMDGAFLLYHNTQDVFGFQYLSLEEIDYRIYGSTYQANWAFDMGSRLLQEVVGAIDQHCSGMGDLTVVTTIGDGHVDFYVDQVVPAEAKKLETPAVLQLRLELKRMVNNYEVPNDESFFAPAEGDDLQMSTKLSVTEVERAKFEKFLFLAGYHDIRKPTKPKVA